MNAPPIVVARVLLRSAQGERPGVDVPISADTLGRLAPPAGVVDAVADHFRGAGFTLLGAPGLTIGISGSKELFERHFGVALECGAGDAYAVQPARARGRSRSTTADDPTSVPVDRLPPAIRRAVSQIALEAAVSLDQPGVDR